MSSQNPRYRQLSDSLALLRGGAVNDEGGRHLNAAICAVEATGKSAEVTLTLKISPAAKNSEMLKVESAYKVKLPESDRAPALFYVDSNHNLSAENPAAPTRGPVRSIEPETDKPVKEVANG